MGLVLRRADPADGGRIGRQYVRADVAQDRGVGEAGRDDVDCHALVHELARQRLGEADLAGLGRAVMDQFGIAATRAERRDDDDPAMARFGHHRCDPPGAMIEPVEMIADHPVPLLEAHIQEGHGFRDAGIGDEDVDRPELVDDPVDHRRDRIRIGDVGGNRKRGAARRHDLIDHGLALGRRAAIDGDARAPSAARRRAVAAPMPEPAPVTSAVRPEKRWLKRVVPCPGRTPRPHPAPLRHPRC